MDLEFIKERNSQVYGIKSLISKEIGEDVYIIDNGYVCGSKLKCPEPLSLVLEDYGNSLLNCLNGENEWDYSSPMKFTPVNRSEVPDKIRENLIDMDKSVRDTIKKAYEIQKAITDFRVSDKQISKIEEYAQTNEKLKDNARMDLLKNHLLQCLVSPIVDEIKIQNWNISVIKDHIIISRDKQTNYLEPRLELDDTPDIEFTETDKSVSYSIYCKAIELFIEGDTTTDTMIKNYAETVAKTLNHNCSVTIEDYDLDYVDIPQDVLDEMNERQRKDREGMERD